MKNAVKSIVETATSRRHPQMNDAIQEWRGELTRVPLATVVGLVEGPREITHGSDDQHTKVGEDEANYQGRNEDGSHRD